MKLSINRIQYISRQKRSGMQLIIILFLAVRVFSGCGDDDFTPVTEPTKKNEEEQKEDNDTVTGLDPSTIDTSMIYIPNELSGMDLYDSSSTWYYGRSEQSEHFIVFWGKGYGENHPNSTAVPSAYRVDIDDLLTKAEGFYDVNVNTLKFAELGVGKSNLDNYKMMIFILYQEDWLATGAGYDDVIGALWVSPSTCHPVGSVIAHEIGHSFQYQVYCDLKDDHGFRYGFGGNGGNGFWEQSAQWQAWQSYPNQVFTANDFPVYIENYHRHLCHEHYRYASYFIHYYWADKHGIDFIGKLWREAQEPEDPMEAYMRITNVSVEEFNDEIYEAASLNVTWDIDELREKGSNYIGKQTYSYNELDDGSYAVSYDRCPGTTGYNVIPLNVPDAGTEITTQFTGLVNEDDYNKVSNPGRAGWRYGYVALKNDGERVYSDMFKSSYQSYTDATFTLPDDVSKLWFVVTGAPNTYLPHAWDEDNTNDDQWPYKLEFTNTDMYGKISFEGDETPVDTTLTFDVAFPFNSTEYSGTSIELAQDLNKLAYAFVLQPASITSELENKITWYAVESNGTLNDNTTANGYGHWFDASGNVCDWGSDARVYSEFDENNFIFTIGQYPGQCAAGDEYTIKQAMVYEYEAGKTVQATFIFKITIN